MKPNEELIKQNPHLTPGGEGGNPLVLAAKNLRAELKKEGITALVKTSRFAGGDSINLSVLDENQVGRAYEIGQRYRSGTFDSQADYTDTKHTSWTQTFGDAKFVHAQLARFEDREKMLGTYKAPPKKELTKDEVFSRFLKGVGNGTESTTAKHFKRFKAEYPQWVDQAWDNATRAYGLGKTNGSVKAMLDAGHNPNAPAYAFSNVGGGNALHLSVYRSDPQTSKLLIDAGTSINALNKKGQTPLHLAASHGQQEITEMLLSNGADPNLVDNNGHPPSSQLPDVQNALDVARAAIRRQSLSEIASQHRPIDALKDHSAQQAIDRADRDGSTDLMDGATLHTAANLADAGYDTAQAPYWLAQRGQEPTPITGAADPSLRPHVAIDERVAVYDQEIAVASTPATLSPGHRQEELASAQQVQAKRKAYGRAM